MRKIDAAEMNCRVCGRFMKRVPAVAFDTRDASPEPGAGYVLQYIYAYWDADAQAWGHEK